MYLVVIAIFSAVTATYVGKSFSDGAFEATKQEMQVIRDALVGDEAIETNGTRSDFGYHGDIGALPSTLAGLTTQPGGVSAFSTDYTNRFSSGWRGPYLRAANSGEDFTNDGWGRDYVYSPSASPPTLVSYGADGVAGGTGLDQDITVQLPTDSRLATVNGFLVDAVTGAPADVAATVTLNYPNGSGARTTATDSVVVGDKGFFSFSNVPQGVRSASIVVGTTTYGPLMFTVDRSNYTIPTSLTKVTTATCTTQVIQFAASTSSGSEATTSVNISVQTSATCTAPMTVDYTVAAGTATAGSDFTAASGTLTIPAGALSANVTVAVINDAVAEDSETFTVTLSSPTPTGVTLGARTVHTYTILYNDCATSPTQLAANGTYTVTAGCNRLTIKAWGGGGGAGGSSSGKAAVGGAGGYVYTATALTVATGDVYTVVIGQGGNAAGPKSPTNCTGGSGGEYAGGTGGNLTAGSSGAGPTVLSNGGTGGSSAYAGGGGAYGGGGGGGGNQKDEKGGSGGGATAVKTGGSTIIIAGGGGGGGGASGGGGNAGAGGGGCSRAGVNGGNQAGGGGGAGACTGPTVVAGTGGRTPSNSAQAGTYATGGDVAVIACANGAGTGGLVIFEPSSL